MNYWRCKCGETQYWESGMTPAKCKGCDKCSSTLATWPGGHGDIEPHTPGTPRLEVDQDVCYRITRCRRCLTEISREEVAR